MNYEKIYNNLINTARETIIPHGVYKERHHIVPKCMGGSNDESNLVYLTAKQHYIAHLLLILPDDGRTDYLVFNPESIK